MGQHARIDHGYIEIDTEAWLAQRVTGSVALLNERFTDFSHGLSRLIGTTLFPMSNLDRVEAFILARCGREWMTGEPQCRVQIETHHAVSLKQGIFIHRYSDPEELDVVFVTPVAGPYVTGSPIAYRDTRLKPELWTSLQAQILCPGGHQYLYGAATVTVDNILHSPIADVFSDGRLITVDRDPASATHGQSRILCPRCAAACDVELPHL